MAQCKYRPIISYQRRVVIALPEYDSKTGRPEKDRFENTWHVFLASKGETKWKVRERIEALSVFGRPAGGAFASGVGSFAEVAKLHEVTDT